MIINYILVSSPDKISMVSFSRFLRRAMGKDYEVGEMHNLMSEESVNLYVEDFTKKFPKGIISFYARKAINKDPESVIPDKLKEKADIIIWFDLYSTVPRVLKDPESNMKALIENWNEYIKRLSI